MTIPISAFATDGTGLILGVGATSAAIDILLYRDGANTLALRNGVNAQTFNIYNTYTDASNYERLAIDWTTSASTATISTVGAGTGASNRQLKVVAGGQLTLQAQNGNPVQFSTGGSSRWNIDTSGNFVAVTDNTYDIGAVGATRPRTIYAGTSVVTAALLSSTHVDAGSSSYFLWTNRSLIRSPADGQITLLNNAETAFSSLQFGGTTSSFPALARSSAKLVARLADDSADATFQSAQLIASGIASDATHTDATVCVDTTSKQFYSGSGTLGICLGTSSLRYKSNVLPLGLGLSEIAKLETIRYRYLPGKGTADRDLYGFAAEQVVTVMPELVGLDPEGRPNSVDWAGLVPVIVNAMKEQQEMIEALQRTVDGLSATRH